MPPRPASSSVPPWVVVIIVVGVVVLACCGVRTFIGVLGSGRQATTYRPAAFATDTPAPTATPVPLITGPVLGGTADAFDAAFGARIDSSTWSATVGGQETWIHLTGAAGTDGHPRAAIITISPPLDRLGSQTWPVSTLGGFALRFVPPGSAYEGSETGPHGERIYDMRSDRLAATFPPSVFTNDAGTSLKPPGSLNWSCFLSSGASSDPVDECQISVGTYH